MSRIPARGAAGGPALIRITIFASLFALLNSGCLPAYPNKPLAPQKQENAFSSHDQQKQYRFDDLKMGSDNSDDIFVCVSISGGGARAASFGYGVLEGLHQTSLPATANTSQRSLLEEVDIISGSSGGSFPAASYAVWREKIFGETFRSQFYARHSRKFLTWLMVRPWHVFSLMMAAVDRVNVVATFCDEKVFEGKTYRNLLEDEDRGDRPFLVINATNVANHQSFEFTQDDFDMLGSDLSSMPIGWATAASSAYPLVLSPLRLKYHPQPEGANCYRQILESDNKESNRRRREWARSLVRESDPDNPDYTLDKWNHKYLYLLDGGLTDNLALRYFLQELRYGVINDRIKQGKIKHLVVISVDAAAERNAKLESRFTAPGLFRVGYATGRTGVDNLSLILTQAISHFLIEEPNQRAQLLQSCNHELQKCGCQDVLNPDVNEPQYHFVQIRLLDIDDDHLRTLSTLSSPSPEDLRKLSDEGRQMLTNNKEFQVLLRSLGATQGENSSTLVFDSTRQR